MSAPGVPRVALSAATSMPVVGLGVYQVEARDLDRVVDDAVACGYRLFDTASAYGTEAALGRALARSGLDRSRWQVVSKLWNDEQGRANAGDALARTLDRLGTDHVDLYLVHWPAPALDRYVETWERLLELRAAGLAREVGVANFDADHLRRIVAATGVAPAVNQLELHPYLQQAELVAFTAALGTVAQAWSPLARGGAVLRDEVIGRIARDHGRTPGQVILRWHLQRGVPVIPKTTSRARLAENVDLFSFALTDAEMRDVAAVDRGTRTGPDPRTYDQEVLAVASRPAGQVTE